MVDGICFISGGDGHWYSTCGRFGIFHMLRETAQATWELQKLGPGREMGEYLHDEIGFSMLLKHSLTAKALRQAIVEDFANHLVSAPESGSGVAGALK